MFTGYFLSYVRCSSSNQRFFQLFAAISPSFKTVTGTSRKLTINIWLNKWSNGWRNCFCDFIFCPLVLSIIVYDVFQKYKLLLIWRSNWFLPKRVNTLFGLESLWCFILFGQKTLAYSLKHTLRKQSNSYRRIETNITAPNTVLTREY